MQKNLDNKDFEHDNKILNGSALKNRESRLEKDLEAGTITLDGEKELQNIKKKLKDARNIINNRKEVTTDTDNRNTFNVADSPTSISTPKVTDSHSGGPKSKILSNNQAISEGITKEISEIRYLIEYMTNNKKQNL